MKARRAIGADVLSILAIVLPIFALIFAGWLTGRAGILGPAATRELNRFVVWLALPALLFDIIAHAHWTEVWRPGFILAVGGGMAAVFALTIALRWRRVHLADALVDGLNAAYPNTAFMGFPIALAILGRATLPLTTIATLLTVCLLFASAIILIEFSLSESRGKRAIMRKVAGSLARNPLLMAPVAGALFAATGLAIPPPVESFLKLLGSATSPCALVAIGLFLAHERGGGTADARAVALLVSLKLAVQPALTWAIADRLLGLPHLLTATAVLMAALPTGTGPFMLAQFYTREGATTSRVILLSTILSIATVPLWLSFLI
ncbi:MAG: AEC family transporter [Sphingobium sp.]